MHPLLGGQRDKPWAQLPNPQSHTTGLTHQKDPRELAGIWGRTRQMWLHRRPTFCTCEGGVQGLSVLKMKFSLNTLQCQDHRHRGISPSLLENHG